MPTEIANKTRIQQHMLCVHFCVRPTSKFNSNQTNTPLHTQKSINRKNQLNTTHNTKIAQTKFRNTTDSSVVSPKIPKLTTNLSLGAVRRQSSTTAASQADAAKYQQLFSKTTKAIVWGMQTRAVQSMLDFDFICR